MLWFFFFHFIHVLFDNLRLAKGFFFIYIFICSSVHLAVKAPQLKPVLGSYSILRDPKTQTKISFTLTFLKSALVSPSILTSPKIPESYLEP